MITPPTYSSGRRAAVITLVALGYVVGFGLADFAAIAYLRDPNFTLHIGNRFLQVMFALGYLAGFPILSLIIAAMAMSLLGRAALREWAIGRPRSERGPNARGGADAWSAFMFVAAMWVGTILSLFLHLPKSTANDGNPVWLQITRSVFAGIGEEPIVVAAPIVAFRWLTAGRRVSRPALVAFFAGLVVIRMFYHLYYGWGAIALLTWAIVVPIVYWRVGRLWPLIAVHIAFDICSFLAQDGKAATAAASMVLLLGTGLLLSMWLGQRYRPKEPAGMTQPPPYVPPSSPFGMAGPPPDMRTYVRDRGRHPAR